MAIDYKSLEDLDKLIWYYEETENALEILFFLKTLTQLDKNSPEFFQLENPTEKLYKKYNYKLFKAMKDLIEIEQGQEIGTYPSGNLTEIEDDYYGQNVELHGQVNFFLSDDDNICYTIQHGKVTYSKTPRNYTTTKAAYPDYDEIQFGDGRGYVGDYGYNDSYLFWRAVYLYVYDYSINSGIHFVRKNYINLLASDGDPQVWYLKGNVFPYFSSLENSSLQLTDDLRENYWGGILPTPQEATYNIDRASTPKIDTSILSRRVYFRLGFPVSDPVFGWYMGVPWYYGSPYSFHNHYLRFYEGSGNLELFHSGGEVLHPPSIMRPTFLFYPPIPQFPQFTALISATSTDWLLAIIDGSWAVGDVNRKLR